MTGEGMGHKKVGAGEVPDLIFVGASGFAVGLVLVMGLKMAYDDEIERARGLEWSNIQSYMPHLEDAIISIPDQRGRRNLSDRSRQGFPKAG